MKIKIILLGMLVAGSAFAGQTNAPLSLPVAGPKSTPPSNPSVPPTPASAATTITTSRITIEAAKAKAEMNGEVATRGIRAGGIAVQVVRSRNPFQLINPMAPAEYWNGAQNVSYGTVTHSTGLNFLSLKF